MSDKENSQSSTQNEQIAFERPEVENEPNKKLMIGAVFALCLIVIVMVALSFLGKNKEQNEVIKTQVQQIGTDIRQKIFVPFEKNDKNFDQENIAQPKIDNQLPLKETTKANPLNNNSNNDKKPNFVPKVFKTSGSLMIVSTSPNQQTQNYTPDQNISWAEQTRRLEEEKEYNVDVYTPKIAKKSKFNPSLLLQKGTYIGCSLNTRLVSQIKGGISCTTSEDVYSEDGVTLLIEKGSKIFGSFRSGQMNDGMNRIFVVWSEIRTPNNIIIPVQSGASDELGGSGMKGYVDHQWMTRFGASILLSMIDDVFNYAANGKRNNNADYTENTRDATQEMAKTALEEFIKIKPVLYVNQGDIVGVYVNRDIDFSKVYKLKVSKKR